MKPKGHVAFILDNDSTNNARLKSALKDNNVVSLIFFSVLELINKNISKYPDIILTDINQLSPKRAESIQLIQIRYPDVPLIIMTQTPDLGSILTAYRGGAYEYLKKPLDSSLACRTILKALKNDITLDAPIDHESTDNLIIIGTSSAMLDIYRTIARLSHSHDTVLITGESGTGKELIAREIYRNGPRVNNPYIALNIAAIPSDLLESELFGHEKGAFTGAYAKRIGRFEQAHGGTLFLDEIGDMPLHLQNRLLRVLEEGEFFPVGAELPIKVNVRIIAATHQRLDELVSDGRFRIDLYHRLNVIRINVPPLRDRRSDIPNLLSHYLNQSCHELGISRKMMQPETIEYLCTLDWPGNVRQLQNTCRWMSTMVLGDHVYLEDLPADLTRHDFKLQNQQPDKEQDEGWEALLRQNIKARLIEGDRDVASQIVDSVERLMIEIAIDCTHGRRVQAADILGYGRNTLSRKLKRFNRHSGTMA